MDGHGDSQSSKGLFPTETFFNAAEGGHLPCPMMAVNDAKAKHYYDNKYGTGQSTWDAIMHTTNLIVHSRQ